MFCILHYSYWTVYGDLIEHQHLRRNTDLCSRIEGAGTRSSLRLLAAHATHSMHSLEIHQGAFQGVDGGTLRLISQRMPLEPIIVRAIVQIPLRLIQFGRPYIVHYVLSVRWGHDYAISIVFNCLVVFYKFHESLALITIAEVLFEFIENRMSVRKILLILLTDLAVFVNTSE